MRNVRLDPMVKHSFQKVESPASMGAPKPGAAATFSGPLLSSSQRTIKYDNGRMEPPAHVPHDFHCRTSEALPQQKTYLEVEQHPTKGFSTERNTSPRSSTAPTGRIGTMSKPQQQWTPQGAGSILRDRLAFHGHNVTESSHNVAILHLTR